MYCDKITMSFVTRSIECLSISIKFRVRVRNMNVSNVFDPFETCNYFAHISTLTNSATKAI